MSEIDGDFVYPKIEMGDFNGKALLTMVKQGITRRDWLAGMAMQGLLASPRNQVGVDGKNDPSNTNTARLSYMMADTLILEGRKGGE